jgi:hypothetical protein
MLRHRIQPHLSRLPEELRDLARPKKCIRVKSPPPRATEFTLEDFHQQQAMAVPPVPPVPQADFPQVINDGWTPVETDEDRLWEAERRAEREEKMERRQRQQLRDEQEMEYIQSLIEDQERAAAEDQVHENVLSADSPVQEDFQPPVTEQPVFEHFSPPRSLTGVAGAANAAVSVMVKLPTGERLEAIFSLTSTVQDVCRWISSERQIPPPDAVFTNLPKQQWHHNNTLENLPVERRRLLLFIE